MKQVLKDMFFALMITLFIILFVYLVGTRCSDYNLLTGSCS